jgi:hypothetical protein
VAFAEPDEHDFAVGVHVGERNCANLGQRLDCVAVHLGDAADGVTGRKDAA